MMTQKLEYLWCKNLHEYQYQYLIILILGNYDIVTALYYSTYNELLVEYLATANTLGFQCFDKEGRNGNGRH